MNIMKRLLQVVGVCLIWLSGAIEGLSTLHNISTHGLALVFIIAGVIVIIGAEGK